MKHIKPGYSNRTQRQILYEVPTKPPYLLVVKYFPVERDVVEAFNPLLSEGYSQFLFVVVKTSPPLLPARRVELNEKNWSTMHARKASETSH